MANMMINPTTETLAGTIPVPPSKYHIHRSLILGSLAYGRSTVHGRSSARHVGFTVSALRAMGSEITQTEDGYLVHGGSYHARVPQIDVGNSGSTLQFLLGLGALVDNGPVIFEGEPSLMRRPVQPLLEGLRTLGIPVRRMDFGLGLWVPPSKIKGGTVMISGLLSQWASSILLVAPFAERGVTVILSEPIQERNYVTLTARMMEQFGVHVDTGENGTRWRVEPGQTYRPAEIASTPDLSSAAFILALAALHSSRITLTEFNDDGSEHPEGRILDIMRAMGLPLQVDRERAVLSVRHDGRRLTATDIDMRDIPDLFPILCVVAATAKGTTVLRHVHPARYKESDRVAAMMQLRAMGAQIDDAGDEVIIQGVDQLHGADLSIPDDHRVLMAYAVAATAAQGSTTLSHPWAYRISYPEFRVHLQQLGVSTAVGSPLAKVSLV